MVRSATASPKPGGAVDLRPGAYLPGLDGLRGVAVLAVVLFHAGVPWMRGGALGVSTFFTLSGFLITRLLLQEHRTDGSISLRAFWARRVRRLLPGALMAVALAGVVVVAVGTPAARRSFGGDATSSLLDVANWWFIAAGRSYQALFSAPSPLQHMWSLGVEAQFYWLYPVLLAGIVALARGRRGPLAAALVAVAAGSVLAPSVFGFDYDRAYYGTDARLAEILVGALMALLVDRWVARGRFDQPVFRRAIGIEGLGAAVLLLVVWTNGSITLDVIRNGGLALHAVVSAVVMLAACVPGTALAGALSTRPLVGLGRISYGVYLYHWPILVALGPMVGGADRGPIGSVIRVVAALVLSVGAAALSYRYVEQPIRSGARFTPRATSAGLASAMVVAMVGAIAVTATAPPAAVGEETAASGSLSADLGRLTGAPASIAALDRSAGSEDALVGPSAPEISATVGLVPKPVPTASRPVRVLVLGDSVAISIGSGLATWGDGNGAMDVATQGRIGCGVVRGGDVRTAFAEGPYDPACSSWPTEWPALIRDLRPDVIVLSSSYWDATDRRTDAAAPWRAPGDPAFDEAFRREYRLALDELTASAVPVLWLDHPPIFLNEVGWTPTTFPQIYDPARMARLDELQGELAAGRPDVRILRTRPWFEAWPPGWQDPAVRSDGLHIRGPQSTRFIEWLGPEIVAAYWAGVPGS